MRKVYVIMCNDYPKGVAGSAAKARKICDEKMAADTAKRAAEGLGSFQQYWRWYEFTLNGEV